MRLALILPNLTTRTTPLYMHDHRWKFGRKYFVLYKLERQTKVTRCQLILGGLLIPVAQVTLINIPPSQERYIGTFSASAQTI